MKFTLEISMDNADFADGGEDSELYALLGDVRTVVAMGLRGGIVRDSNGNRVGAWEIEAHPRDPRGDGYDCSGGCRHHCGDQAADWCGRSLSEGWCPEHGYGTPPK